MARLNNGPPLSLSQPVLGLGNLRTYWVPQVVFGNFLLKSKYYNY